jgi:hypothetical protein
VSVVGERAAFNFDTVCNFSPAAVFLAHNQVPKMKSTRSLLLLGITPLAIALFLTPVNFIALAFAVGLTVWTILQYRRVPRTLQLTRSLHLPIAPAVIREKRPLHRMAA